VLFFRLSSLELALIVFGIVLGAVLLGIVVGRRLRVHVDTLRKPFRVVQAALAGLVALILAFGLTMAVGRYDARRAAVVASANAIGTASTASTAPGTRSRRRAQPSATRSCR
jgi:hypothetical protein